MRTIKYKSVTLKIRPASQGRAWVRIQVCLLFQTYCSTLQPTHFLPKEREKEKPPTAKQKTEFKEASLKISVFGRPWKCRQKYVFIWWLNHVKARDDFFKDILKEIVWIIKMCYFLAGGTYPSSWGDPWQGLLCSFFPPPAKKKWVEDKSLIFGLCKSSVNLVPPCHFGFLMPDQAPLSWVPTSYTPLILFWTSSLNVVPLVLRKPASCDDKHTGEKTGERCDLVGEGEKKRAGLLGWPNQAVSAVTLHLTPGIWP